MKNKNTHTVQDIENLMFEYLNKIRDAETKTEKLALTKKLKSLESHYNSCQDKHINGKAYPKKRMPTDISKKELLALIDSVNPTNGDYDASFPEEATERIKEELDVTGVSVGSNRFTYVD